MAPLHIIFWKTFHILPLYFQPTCIYNLFIEGCMIFTRNTFHLITTLFKESIFIFKRAPCSSLWRIESSWRRSRWRCWRSESRRPTGSWPTRRRSWTSPSSGWTASRRSWSARRRSRPTTWKSWRRRKSRSRSSRRNWPIATTEENSNFEEKNFLIKCPSLF